MVEEVEELRTELECHVLLQLGPLAEAHIPIVNAGAAHQRPAGIAERAQRGDREHIGVEPPGQRHNAGNRTKHVRTLPAPTGSGAISGDSGSERIARLEVCDARYLPSMKGLALPAPRLASYWQLPNIAPHKDMRAVEAGERALLPVGRVGVYGSDGIVDDLTERVRSLHGETGGETPDAGYLQRVVDRIGCGFVTID